MRSCAGWGQKCPADETYPNCVSGLPYLRDKDSLPTDSVRFALTETRSSILDTTEPIPSTSPVPDWSLCYDPLAVSTVASVRSSITISIARFVLARGGFELPTLAVCAPGPCDPGSDCDVDCSTAFSAAGFEATVAVQQHRPAPPPGLNLPVVCARAVAADLSAPACRPH